MARAAKVQLDIDDFQKISDRTPYLADLKPSGSYVMEELHNIGGIPAVQKLLIKEGLLHGDQLTVTGKTLAENLEDLPGLEVGQTIIAPVVKPIKKTGHLTILYGNLAEEGAVAKITGKEGTRFSGFAKVYDSEEECLRALEHNEISEGSVVVIRYEGPRGGPGMREMLKVTSAIMGAGFGDKIALITDGRFSGGTHGFVVGHVSPEAQAGGILSIVKDGDRITIDADEKIISLEIGEDEIQKRRATWSPPPQKILSGVLYKYMKTVTSASRGCVTDEF